MPAITFILLSANNILWLDAYYRILPIFILFHHQLLRLFHSCFTLITSYLAYFFIPKVVMFLNWIFYFDFFIPITRIYYPLRNFQTLFDRSPWQTLLDDCQDPFYIRLIPNKSINRNKRYIINDKEIISTFIVSGNRRKPSLAATKTRNKIIDAGIDCRAQK